MAKNSRIEWTEHTFNPWWGCRKVSPACDNCYAEAWAKRTGHDVWGTSSRRFLSDTYWKQPIRWEADARKTKSRARVFCASMADVFEWGGELSKWRSRLWRLIEATPHLDWLLLTKRPHLAERLTPWGSNWPTNVWLGTTVESDEFVAKRIPHLAASNASIRFLSCEPLRSTLDLSSWLSELDWVIAGGESGPGARPSDPNWFRQIRDQSNLAGVPFHFKQWGDWAPLAEHKDVPRAIDTSLSEPMGRFGKKRCGRTLDGVQWGRHPVR